MVDPVKALEFLVKWDMSPPETSLGKRALFHVMQRNETEWGWSPRQTYDHLIAGPAVVVPSSDDGSVGGDNEGHNAPAAAANKRRRRSASAGLVVESPRRRRQRREDGEVSSYEALDPMFTLTTDEYAWTDPVLGLRLRWFGPFSPVRGLLSTTPEYGWYAAFHHLFHTSASLDDSLIEPLRRFVHDMGLGATPRRTQLLTLAELVDRASEVPAVVWQRLHDALDIPFFQAMARWVPQPRPEDPLALMNDVPGIEDWLPILVPQLGFRASVLRGLDAFMAAAMVWDPPGDDDLFFAVMTSAERGHVAVVRRLLLQRPEALQTVINRFGGHGNTVTPLYTAAFRGDAAMVQLLLGVPGIQVNLGGERDTAGPLHAATRSELVGVGVDYDRTVQLLVDAPGINVNQANHHDRTPLYTAVNGNKPALVQILLNVPGIRVNVVAGDTDRTPLTLASNRGYESIVQLLVEEAPGIDVNHVDGQNETALTVAIHAGNAAIVERLLGAPGIRVNQPGPGGETPLFRAIRAGNVDIVQRLLAVRGIQVNHTNDRGESPLFGAVATGNTAIVQLVLGARRRIHVNQATHQGDTPLSLAAKSGSFAMVRLLLATPGIDIAPLVVHLDVLMRRAIQAGNIDMVRLLAEYVPSRHLAPVLFFAVENRDLNMVKEVLTVPGIHVNALVDQRSALMVAVVNRDVDIVRLLVAVPGIDVNRTVYAFSVNEERRYASPLYYAAARGLDMIVQILLGTPGIHVNQMQTTGKTALFAAIRNVRESVVRILLGTPGIHVNQTAPNGDTALSLAVQEGFSPIIRQLLAVPGIQMTSDMRRHLIETGYLKEMDR